MRYYTAIISDPDTGEEIRRYTSLTPTGINNPSALNVELDIPVYTVDAPVGAAFLKVWGISIKDIGAAFDLNQKTIKIYAGMSAGLPLSNPEQAGLILQGQVQQAFGNWQDTSQSIDLIINADGGTAQVPKNIVLNWKKGLSLAQAISSTLGVAFPSYTATIDIDEKLILNQDEVGYFETITQFAQYIKTVSQNILKGTYQGVSIVIKEKEFVVFDGSSQEDPLEIAFTDLIGQPTWIGLGQLQFKCVMRADLLVSDFVRLPQGQAVTTAQSYSQFRNQTDFQGTFQIDAIRHIGNFRQPDAASWVTVFNAHIP